MPWRLREAMVSKRNEWPTMSNAAEGGRKMEGEQCERCSGGQKRRDLGKD